MKKLFFGVLFLVLLHTFVFSSSVDRFDRTWEENNNLTLYNDSFVEISYEQFRFILTTGSYTFLLIKDNDGNTTALQLARLKEEEITLIDGGSAPGFSGTTFSGDELSFSNPPDKPVLLVFFSTACSYCVDEIPLLNEFAQREQELGFRMIGLTFQSKEALRAFHSENKLAFPVIFGQRETMERYEVQGIPAHVIIDTTGKIVWRKDAGSSSILEQLYNVLSTLN